MTTLITSQHFIDDSIVESKISNRDFEVLVSPQFDCYLGQSCRVILDGHHSYAAAIRSGNEPVLVEASKMEHDAIGILDRGDVDLFLEVVHMGGDYETIDWILDRQ